MMLPAAVRAALARCLEGVSRNELAERQARISERYRAGKGSDQAIRDDLDALAYAVARMPATFAACTEACTRTASLLGDFTPRSMLDLGAGPGAATFAAREVWPSIAKVRQVEISRHFRALARSLAGDGEALAADVTAPGLALETADIVVASYVLVEQSPEAADRLLAQAMRHAHSLLVLVEPGTTAGFSCLRRARRHLAAAGWSIAAPCPGAMPCPMSDGDWCHFSVRLERSRDHKLVKAVDVPFEDERFAYIAATRTLQPVPVAARVLSEPEQARDGIGVKLCTPAGLERRRIARRDKPAYKAARRLRWGDEI